MTHLPLFGLVVWFWSFTGICDYKQLHSRAYRVRTFLSCNGNLEEKKSTSIISCININDLMFRVRASQFLTTISAVLLSNGKSRQSNDFQGSFEIWLINNTGDGDGSNNNSMKEVMTSNRLCTRGGLPLWSPLTAHRFFSTVLKVSYPNAGTWTEAAATFVSWPRTAGSTARAVGNVCCWRTTDACVSRDGFKIQSWHKYYK